MNVCEDIWKCEECDNRKEDEEDRFCYECYGWITCSHCGKRFCDPEEDKCFNCDKPYKTYQVRVYYDDLNRASCDFVEDKNGKWEFNTVEKAFKVFLSFEKEKDDVIVILTETPVQTEEQCKFWEKTYEIKEICKK